MLHLGVGTGWNLWPLGIIGHRWVPLLGTVRVDTIMVGTVRVGIVRVGTVSVGTIRVDYLGAMTPKTFLIFNSNFG